MRLIIIILLVLTLSLPLLAQEGLLGAEWVEMSQEEQETYLSGVAEGAAMLQGILLEARILSAPIALMIWGGTWDQYIIYLDAYYRETGNLEQPVIYVLHAIEVQGRRERGAK